jgi:diaminopimelate decarboxylase
MCFTNKNTLKKLMKNSQIQLVKNQNLTTPALNRFAKPSDINTLVALYGTPLYLIDEDTLHTKARELHNAYSKFNGPVKVAYSMKANFSPAILRTFINDGITFDLTSIGELRFLKECKGDRRIRRIFRSTAKWCKKDCC